jgi:hypothetical protein
METEMNNIVSLIRNIFRKLNSFDELVVVNPIEKDSVVIDGWIYLSIERNTTHTVETLEGKEIKTGTIYRVETAIPIHNYPHEPDDIDVVEVLSTPNKWTAIKKVLELYCENAINNVLESMSMDEYLKEEEKM